MGLSFFSLGVYQNYSNRNHLLAATNNYINFQARILQSNGSVVLDGNYNVEFKIYNQASGGSELWTETYTGANRIRTVNGYITTSLGSIHAFDSHIPDWSEELWATMNIGGTDGTPSWDGEMGPNRMRITAVPYAMKANSANTLSVINGSYTSTLQITPPTGGSQTFSLPNLAAATSATLITTGNLSSITAVGTIASGTWQGGTIGVGYGGTGATSFTSNGILYGNGGNTIQVTAASGTGTYCLSSTDGGAPTWGTCGAGSGSYIDNQNSSQQTANFWISGTGRADTSFSAPLILNGSTANNVLILQGNNAVSGNTATNANIQFKVGDSGGTIAMSILNNGNVGINTISPTAKLDISGAGITTEASLGSELVTNGTFTGDVSGWTLNANWSYNNNNIIHTAGSTATATQSLSLSAGAYQVVYTVENRTVGTIQARLRGFSGHTLSYNVTNFTEIITIDGNGSIEFIPSNDFNGTIDNVSIKRVVQTSALQVLRNSDNTVGLEVRAGGTGSYSTFIGVNAGSSNSSNNNSAFGYNALQSNTSGNYNLALGSFALQANTTGINNVAVGPNALQHNEIGGSNVAVGANALLNNSIGSDNVAVGNGALAGNTIGGSNNAFGSLSLSSNTIGRGNNAFGLYTMMNSTTADFNTAMGTMSMRNNTTGGDNASFGAWTLYYNVDGTYNTAMGSGALQYTTTGDFNVGLGGAALGNNVSGNNNTALGSGTGFGYSPAATTTASVAAGGSVNIGEHRYRITYVINGRETNIGGANWEEASATTSSGNQTVNLSNIPTYSGPFAGGTITRNVYRTKLGNNYTYYFVSNINNNTTTTYSDTATDESLGSAFAGPSSSIMLGAGANAMFSNQLVVGNSSNYVNESYWGGGIVASSPQNFGFYGTSGSGTNVTGASMLFGAGRGTGSGAGGDIIFQTAAAGSAGSNINNLSEVMRITSAGNVGIGTSTPTTAKLVVKGTTTTSGAASLNIINSSDTSLLYVRNDGNVGIGTTNPGSRLTVVGSNSSATISSNNLLSADETFATSNGWTTGSGWSIGSGVASVTGGGSGGLDGTTQFLVGPKQLVFDVDSITSSGWINITLGGSTTSYWIGSTGTNTMYFATNGSGVSFSGSYFVGSIDNVRIYSVNNSNADLTVISSDQTSSVDIRTGGNTSESIFIGQEAGQSNYSGLRNIVLGTYAMSNNITGSDNSVVGTLAMNSNITGYGNTAMGYRSLQLNQSGGFNSAFGLGSLNSNLGSNNTAIGYQAGNSQTNASGNVFLGYRAGYYETGSNKLFVDNQQRASEADARTKALIYGIFDSSVANQYLNVNGQLQVTGTGNSYISGNLGVGDTSPTEARLSVQGSTADSTANVLFVTDSGGSNNLFTVRNDGHIGIGDATDNDTYVNIQHSQDASTSQRGVFNLQWFTPTANQATAVAGFESSARKSGTYDLFRMVGLWGNAVLQGSGTVTGMMGVKGSISLFGTDGESGTVSNSYALWAESPTKNPTNSQSITNNSGLYISNQGDSFITNSYGIYLQNQTGSTTNNYSIYSAGGLNYLAGNLGVGSIPSASTRLLVKGSTADNSAAALNVTDSSDASLLYVRNDGNVGIGTTSPGAKLDVAGDVFFGDTSYGKKIYYSDLTVPTSTGDSTHSIYLGRIRVGVTTLNISAHGYGAAQSAEFTLSRHWGGTSAAAPKIIQRTGELSQIVSLHYVQYDNYHSDIFATYTYSAPNGESNYLKITAETSGSDTGWSRPSVSIPTLDSSNIIDSIMTLLASGNVGIGVTNPSAFLQVAGATTSAASLRVTSSAGVDPSSPNIGDLWFNGTNLNFRKDGSTTVDLLAGAGCPTCIYQAPTTTAQNTIQPATSAVIGLTVNGTNTGTAAQALVVNQAYAADGINLNLTNTSGTQTSGMQITRNGAGGTTTSLLGITNTAGTATNGILFTGTIGTDIATASGRALTITANAASTWSTTAGNLTLQAGSGTIVSGSHILPSTDDTYDLGSSSYRWRDLYLGPTSLHVSSTAAETTTARDWKFGIQESDGNTEGNFRLVEGSSELLTMTTSGNLGVGISAPTAKLQVTGTDNAASNYGFMVAPASSAELITNVVNRDFSGAGNWTGTGWTVGSGLFTHSAGANSATLANANFTASSILAGHMYKLTFTVSSIGGATPSITPYIGTAAGTAVTANGTYTQYITAVADNASLIFTPNATMTGSLDNISLMDTNTSFAITNNGSVGIGTVNPGGILEVTKPNTIASQTGCQGDGFCTANGNTTSAGNKGYQFRTDVDGYITQLWVGDPYSTHTKIVRLYDDQARVLASADLSGSTGFRSADITPVYIYANRVYTVSVQTDYGYSYRSTGFTYPHTYNHITIIQGVSGTYNNPAMPQTPTTGWVWGIPDVTFLPDTNPLIEFTVKDDGKVGIGTTAPTKTIDITGNSRIKSLGNEQTAFQIQDASGNSIFNVGTLNNTISINGLNATTADTVLTVKGGLVVGQRWVAVGTSTVSGHTLAYSDDGTNWTGLGLNIFTSYGWGVAWNGSMWVAVGYGGNSAAYSTDGANWVGLGSTVFSTAGRGVAWNGSMWVAVGQGTNSIATSTNGTTWTQRTGTSIFSTRGVGVAWNGSMWVAVGEGANSIAYSYNGVDWTGVGTSIFSTRGNGVAWNGSMWVAVGEGTANTIATSLDGVNWTGRGKTAISLHADSIAWDGAKWLAGGYGANSLVTSTDGINWSGVSTLVSYGQALSWNGSSWLLGGQDIGTECLATSADGSTWTAVNGICDVFNNGGINGVASNNSPNLYPPIGNTAVADIQTWQNSGGGTLSVVDGYGNFGIGTDITGTSRLNIKGKDDTTSYYALMAGGATTTGLAVRNDGNVGIGTINPNSAKLVIQGTTSDSTTASLSVAKSDGTSYIYARNDGRLGVGTTAPNATTHIVGSDNSSSSYSMLVAPAASSELITAVVNRDMSAAVNWSGTGWARNSSLNTLEHTPAGANNVTLANANLTASSIKANHMYKVTFTVSGIGGATPSITPYIGAVAGTAVTANGTYTQYIIAAANDVDLIFTPNATMTGHLDSISLTDTNTSFAINNAGNIGIGTSNPSYLLHVGSTSVTSGTAVARFENAGGTCTVTPNVAGGITCTSDSRLKKDITNYDDALSRVLGLKTVSYHMLAEDSTEQLHVGFIAQDLELTLPDLVVTDNEGIKSISYSGLTPYLTRAIQQQQIKIDSTESNITTLQGSKLNIVGGTIDGSLSILGGLNVSGPTVLSDLNVTNNLTSQNIAVADTATINILKVTGPAEFGGDLKLVGSVNTKQAITKKFIASGPIPAGSVVVMDSTKDGYIATTSIAKDMRIVGVAINEAINLGDVIEVAIGGSVQVSVDQFTAVASGDSIVSDSATGKAKPDPAPGVSTVLGKATSAKDANNLIWILITLQ